VYVYRDTGGEPGDSGAAGGGAEENAAYWYDLPGTGYGADAPPHAPQEARGPFEPLVSSDDPPGAPRPAAPEDPGTAEATVPDGTRPDEVAGAAGEDTATAHARKLEQIKDLYLTAEAIGEANVDKHFDQLLAQQRELIGEYFRQSGAAGPAAAGDQAADGAPPGTSERAPAAAASPYQAETDQAETDPGIRRYPGPSAGGLADAAESTRVTADQPRAW